jgi:hypothetical protein
MRELLEHPAAPLTAFAVVASAFFVSSLLVGREITPLQSMVISYLLMLLTLMWVINDARRRRQIPCFDFGLYCALFFPLSVLWYCCKTRGGWGLLTFLVVLGLWLGPFVIAQIAWVLLYGQG